MNKVKKKKNMFLYAFLGVKASGYWPRCDVSRRDKIGYKYYNNRLSKDNPTYLIMFQQ